MIEIGALKDWLGNPDEEGVTELLTTLETMAVELVEDETGRFFGAVETRTEFLIGDDTRDLHLAENPTREWCSCQPFTSRLLMRTFAETTTPDLPAETKSPKFAYKC